jgi:hypothetical protein
MPANRANYTDPVLTNLTVATMQSLDTFVAEKIFPPVPVQKQGGKYYVYPSDAWNRPEVKPRGVSSETVGGGYELSSDSYYCPIYGFHDDVDHNYAANDDPGIDSYRDAMDYVAYQIMLAKEQAFVTNFLKTGVWTGDATPGTKFSATNSDPIVYWRSKMRVIKDRTGRMPNTLTVTGDVWSVLVDHSAITGRLSTNVTQIGTKALVAGLLELDNLYVADTYVNTAAEGKDQVLAPLASKCSLLTYTPPRPGLKVPSAGYTFKWKGLPGSANDSGVVTSRFYLPAIKSTRMEAEYAHDYKTVSADLGLFMYDVIA